MQEIKKWYDKSDLVTEVTGVTGKDAQEVGLIIEAAFSAIARRLAKDNPVILDNIGTFSLRLRKGRKFNMGGVTGESPDSLKVKFNSAKFFAETVKNELPEPLAHLEVK